MKEAVRYTEADVDALNAQLGQKTAEEIVRWAAQTFGGDIKFANSFGAEDVALMDIISKHGTAISVFTLDTGRLNDETYQVMDAVRFKYEDIPIQVMFPEREAVEALTREKGFFSFRESVDLRKECCAIRKVQPLKRALAGAAAWMTGLRRDQSVTRTDTPAIEWDEGNGLLKVNPIIEWTNEGVWEYISANKVPYNKLHDQHYPSIGCAPCTRAIKDGEDIRAGRWWWENPEFKECGLHE
ncbi:MAG TPA: phosphoadenylyl-sulfate reductase [Dehalococcoidia bacterium]|nr:phosphoadenylyl-sulfate reductase [Dehalococcoidia bacterium]